MNIKNKVIVIAGFACSILILLFITLNINLNQLTKSMRIFHYEWLTVAALFIIMGLFIRSKRWKYISSWNSRSVVPFIDANVIGYCGNLILPARSGELLRVVVIRKWADINSGNALSSAIFDRICDGLATATTLGLILLFYSSNLTIPLSIKIMSITFLLGGIIFFLIILYSDRPEQYSERIVIFFPEIVSDKIRNLFNQIRDASLQLKNPGRIIFILVLSFIVVIIDSGVYLAIFCGFGWNLPIIAGAVLMIFISVASIFPSAPGFLGMYQIACIFALSQFSVDKTDAIACSLIIHILLYTIFLTSFLLVFLRRGVNIIQMWKQIN